MLTLIEKILFVLLALASAAAALRAADRIRRVIRRGAGQVTLNDIPQRLARAVTTFVALCVALPVGSIVSHRSSASSCTYRKVDRPGNFAGDPERKVKIERVANEVLPHVR